MTFDVQANVGGTALLENVTIRSRWLATGAGRGDARITGGDLGTQQAIASECWNTLFRRSSYYTDNVNFHPTEGDPANVRVRRRRPAAGALNPYRNRTRARAPRARVERSTDASRRAACSVPGGLEIDGRTAGHEHGRSCRVGYSGVKVETVCRFEREQGKDTSTCARGRRVQPSQLTVSCRPR